VTNFLLLLDGFLVWKGKQLAREQPFQVHIHPHVSAKSAAAEAWDSFDGCEYVLEEPAVSLPLKYFEAQPCQGKRVVTFQLEFDEEGKNMSALILGNTYAFRQRLDEAGVQGGYTEEASSEARTYYRVIKDIDCSATNDRERLLDVFRRAFNGLALRIVLDGEPETNTPAAEFLTVLKEQPQLHFTR
jgi:hypothetical protein